ncbi:uncharacterized protein [Nicotiana tomentosiformis]|uniref:uncharacterized protein n=1 Tax=Nicotiana tomentosiformis TaxID=4098 RepID=UPI00388C9894
MAGNGEDNVDLAAREATQLIGNTTPDAGRPLGDYARPVYNQGLSSVRPTPVAANNFELKQGLLQTLQNSCVFREKMNEHPNNHLMDFEKIMNTFQYNGVSQDAVYLRAFPFTLKDDAKHWLQSLPNGSIRTWDEMSRKFLDKYFSSAKTGKTLSNAAGDTLMKKTPEEIVTILDELSEDANQWPSEVAERRRTMGVYQVDANTSMQVQLDAMAKEIRKLTLSSTHSEPLATCDICGRGHPTHECQVSIEEVNVVGNYNFNAMGQKHPDFSWSSPGRPQFQPQQPIQSGLEGLMKSFIVKTYEILDAHSAAIKELGTGTLPDDTEKNPKETVNVVTLRSRQVLKDPTPIRKEDAPEKESGKELKIKDDDKKTEKKKSKKGDEKKKKEEISRREESNEESKHMPALPFPQKLYRKKLDKRFKRFLDMLRHVNEILTKKRKVEETSMVKLTEHCSAILKLEKEIGEIKSVPISLQLADQTIITPEGIVEDVLVRVDKFVFPVDFIVVNMEENKEVPIILGRPFLAMGRAVLDIYDRKRMLRVGEETMTFEMNIATGVKREKTTASVEWKLKSSKEKAPVIEKDKCGVYPKKAEKKLSAWMCALVQACGMEPGFNSNLDLKFREVFFTLCFLIVYHGDTPQLKVRGRGIFVCCMYMYFSVC